jgi:hypothetical protein
MANRAIERITVSSPTPGATFEVTHGLGTDDVVVSITPRNPPVGAVVLIPHELLAVTAETVSVRPYLVNSNGQELPLRTGTYAVEVTAAGGAPA